MWNRKKIQAKWSYFRAQRLQPTGNFTEFVVRVYYAVLACCMEGDGRSCPIGQVRNRRLSRFVYRGIYDRPDTVTIWFWKTVSAICADGLSSFE